MRKIQKNRKQKMIRIISQIFFQTEKRKKQTKTSKYDKDNLSNIILKKEKQKNQEKQKDMIRISSQVR